MLSLIAFLALLLFLPGKTHSQTQFKTDDPVEYSNYIVEEQERIGQQFIEFSMQLVNSGDYKSNESKRREVVTQIELGLRRLRNMAPFKGGIALKNEAISVFDMYKKLHTTEYAKIAVLVTNKESSLQALEDYFELQIKAEEKLMDYSGRMKKAQHKFAEKNRLTLVHNPMQDQFDRILEANIYSRQVFLAYIRVAKINEKWWDAMQDDEFEEMKKQRVELLNACKVSTLSSMPGLGGDSNFKDAAQDRIDYFQKLAAKDYEEIAKILESTSRSQEDVDYVNETIENYNNENQALNEKFNKANHDLKMRALPEQSGGN